MGCPGCGQDGPFKHQHETAYGMPETHMDGSEHFKCSVCGYMLTRPEATERGLVYIMDTNQKPGLLSCKHPRGCYLGDGICGWCQALRKAKEGQELLKELLCTPHIAGEGWWRVHVHEEGCPDAFGWDEGYDYAVRLSDGYSPRCRCGGVERERELEGFISVELAPTA